MAPCTIKCCGNSSQTWNLKKNGITLHSEMNFGNEESPLVQTGGTREKMERWVEAKVKGEKPQVEVYAKPSEKQMRELENVRSLSKEMQDSLLELEKSVRIAELENRAMNATAPLPDCSEDHEFMSANQVENVYSQEDVLDAKEEEKARLTKGKAPRTEIQSFYKDQCVFVTGGTGFLGKVVIEKLLRSCVDVDTIYVLVRSKKGKDARSRVHDMLDDFVFHRAHAENPKGIYKVVPIVGDLELPGLGISEEDRKTICSRVTVIINAAATVKFDEKLSLATAINVHGTKEVIRLARECRNLKAITHVSTAYSNPYLKHVEERFYEPPITVEALEAVSQIDQTLLEHFTPKLLGEYPNTYCFTKAVAEEVVRKCGEGLPICIIRPSIIVSTYDEPVRGWTDTMYGPTGLIIGMGTGALRTMYLDTEKVADMVPVDLTANVILASVWYTAKHFKENQTSDIPIYNFVSGAQNPIKWGKFIDMNQKYGVNKPTVKAIWYYGLNMTSKYYMFVFYNFFLHYIPALLVDGYCMVTGKKRVVMKIYYKLMKLANLLFYFTMQQWQFSDHSVRSMWSALSDEDKAIFPFSMAEMSWDHLTETFLVGLRVYLVKDDLSTLPEARKRWNRLFYMHQLLKFITFGLAINFVYVICKYLYNLFFA